MNCQNLEDWLQELARRFSNRQAVLTHGGSDGERYTYYSLERDSRALANGFVDRGLAPDDRVAILSDSRPKWALAFFATVRAGGIFLPLDPALPLEALARIIADSRPRILLVARAYEHLAAAIAAQASPDLLVISLECRSRLSRGPSISSISTMRAQPMPDRHRDHTALLTYTSGTTGCAKGVMTTHGNLLFQVDRIRQVFGNDERCSTVSILPLSHLFEISAGLLAVLSGGGKVCYCNSLLPTEILDAMARQRVTCMVAVPLFLTLLERAIRGEISRRPGAHRFLFRCSIAVSGCLPLAVRRRLFHKLLARFGGQCEYFVCGGAPLDLRTLRFFERVGLPVYQGYGMAEASPVITTNWPGASRQGSVGRPLPGVELRVSTGRGGEILTRGPHVMRGYFGNPDSSKSALDGGWLPTGDTGHIDADGYLYIAGRKKNVIVLGNGKKVQPEAIESVLFAHPDILEGCVVGATAQRTILEGTEEVCAIVVPTPELVAGYADRQHALCRHLRDAITERSRNLARWQRPTRVLVRIEPLPRTATRKLRRPLVVRWVREQLA